LSKFDWIFEEVGLSIKGLAERFVEMPYFFYSEQDMHAYLYRQLISGRLGSFLIDTCFGDKSVLVHREFPTPHAYGRKKGHFDLAIIDPEHALELREAQTEAEILKSHGRPKSDVAGCFHCDLYWRRCLFQLMYPLV